jgi:hypothetical protein
MLEHLASYCTTLDPAATALYACDNDVILSIFAATQSGGDDASQSSKLTADDADEIRLRLETSFTGMEYLAIEIQRHTESGSRSGSISLS